jgi:hypothetical protein
VPSIRGEGHPALGPMRKFPGRTSRAREVACQGCQPGTRQQGPRAWRGRLVGPGQKQKLREPGQTLACGAIQLPEEVDAPGEAQAKLRLDVLDRPGQHSPNEAPVEDGQSPKEGPLDVSEKAMTPVQRGAQRLLAARRGPAPVDQEMNAVV